MYVHVVTYKHKQNVMLIVLTIYSTCTCVCNNAISNLATDSGTKNGMQVGFGEID